MTKNILIYILAFLPFIGMSQGDPTIEDTIVRNGDTIFLFSDKTWEYSHAVNFDGNVDRELAERLSSNNLIQTWDNDVTFNYENDLSLLDDTIWLCTVDSAHMKFVVPHPGMMTSGFKMRGKRFHKGVDVDLQTGDTVRAAFDGIVRYSKYNTAGFGYLTIIRHHNGLETYYAHLSKLYVKPNQKVQAGEVIGLGGKTGRAYGDHLHFEIRFYHNALDPEAVIDFKNQCLKTENLFIHKGMFNYRKISNSKKKNTGTVPKATAAEKNAGPSKDYHIIRSGDSLYALALKHNTTVDKICKLNGISRDKILHTGDKIKLR